MRIAVWIGVLLALVICILGCWCVVPGWDVSAAAAPPLSLDGYLDEKLPEATVEKKADLKVDNGPCYVCHGNYETEELVTVHATEEDGGCMDCHGKSHAHRDDEDNVTPPEKMFAREDIRSVCDKCHDTHDAEASKVIQRWQERCPDRTNPEELVCTDCHFQHRLAFRTVWWDKKTGKLVLRKEGERIKKDEGQTKPRSESPGSQ
jgi:hypothetical protein